VVSSGPRASPAIRFAEITCRQGSCIASCNSNECILRAYVDNRGGTFFVDDELIVAPLLDRQSVLSTA
jgi:hypothetical protein